MLQQTLRLWRSFHFSYPPFTLALRYLLAGGRLVRPCCAREPEVLVGSLPEHTAAVKCHASMSKHGAEVVHCSSRGISFHAGFVVSLLGTLWTAAWPSFNYVMASTLAFIFHQDLTQFMLFLSLQRNCLHCAQADSEAAEYSKIVLALRLACINKLPGDVLMTASLPEFATSGSRSADGCLSSFQKQELYMYAHAMNTMLLPTVSSS